MTATTYDQWKTACPPERDENAGGDLLDDGDESYDALADDFDDFDNE